MFEVKAKQGDNMEHEARCQEAGGSGGRGELLGRARIDNASSAKRPIPWQ